jgi:hypothetical protein
MARSESPYQGSPNRLADVIAAIQTMGSFVYGSRELETWVEELGAPASPDTTWKDIFEQHPEFFRVSVVEKTKDKKTVRETWVTLRWRHAYVRRYHTVKLEELPRAEADQMTREQRKILSRRPLKTEQIEALINTATELHSRAIAHSQERRWWVSLVLSFAGGLIGAILGFLGSILASS